MIKRTSNLLSLSFFRSLLIFGQFLRVGCPPQGNERAKRWVRIDRQTTIQKAEEEEEEEGLGGRGRGDFFTPILYLMIQSSSSVTWGSPEVGKSPPSLQWPHPIDQFSRSISGVKFCTYQVQFYSVVHKSINVHII